MILGFCIDSFVNNPIFPAYLGQMLLWALLTLGLAGFLQKSWLGFVAMMVYAGGTGWFLGWLPKHMKPYESALQMQSGSVVALVMALVMFSHHLYVAWKASDEVVNTGEAKDE